MTHGDDLPTTDRYLIAPDLEHTMRISDFHRTYPEAKCIGPAGVTEKKPDIKWEGVMGEGGESKVYGFEDEVCLSIPEYRSPPDVRLILAFIYRSNSSSSQDTSTRNSRSCTSLHAPLSKPT
jgi:hypothetical protein